MSKQKQFVMNIIIIIDTKNKNTTNFESYFYIKESKNKMINFINSEEYEMISKRLKENFYLFNYK